MSDARPISDTLADFAFNLTFEKIPAPVIRDAKHLFLDAIGVAFASSREPFARTLVDSLSDFGDGDSAVIGFDERLPLRDAVIANGALIHGIDFDDTHLAAVVHPSASAVPTALNVAASLGLNGREVLTAYILAIECSARLGAVAQGEMNQLGFHPTGVIAAFSCAIAAGRLYRLTSQQIAMAQGIALSMAAGTREYSEEGAWTKRLHPGWGAAAGITAAVLARRGFVGPRKTYEGRFGLFETHLGSQTRRYDLAHATHALGERWAIQEVAVKPLPACHQLIAAIDAAVSIAQSEGFDWRTIERVEVCVSPHAVAIVCEPEAAKRAPQSGYATQFSLYFAVACGLVRGRFGLPETEQFHDADILSLTQRVTYTIDARDGTPHFGGRVIVTHSDGRSMTRDEPVPRGSSGNKISLESIAEKFMANTSLVMSYEDSERTMHEILELDHAPDAARLLNHLQKKA